MILDAYIQARMASTRLPGKMMLKLGDKTILEHVIERVRQFKGIRNIVLLTSGYTEDNCLYQIALEQDILCYSFPTPIDRYVFTCDKFKPDWFLRVCGDSPFMSVEMTNQLIEYVISPGTLQYTAYKDGDENIPSSSGLAPEAVNCETFLDHYKNNQEHVTYGLYRRTHSHFYHNPYNFKVTLDTEEDYIKLKAIYEYFGRVPEAWELKEWFKHDQIL